ncbi:MAG TPA: tetratricopeptide repeat protein [Thermoanaerobaculaceae bacterium]|nr:tetratricopeptide repeat protein [Thermoanaerobaculaceae bacterium]
MGRRLTRKQIKQDEFITFVDRGVHWMGSNWRQVAYGLGGLLVVAAVYWGITAYLGSRVDAATQAIAGALDVYDAPVGTTAPADAKLKFATDGERLTAAAKAFEDVRSRYSLTPQARVASLYLARIAVDRGDQGEALRILSEITSKHSSDPIVRLAMLDLLRIRIARGDGPQLAKELEDMASGRDPRLPRDLALFELAKMWDHERKTDEANRLYRKLVEDYPESSYRSEAQQRLSASS